MLHVLVQPSYDTARPGDKIPATTQHAVFCCGCRRWGRVNWAHICDGRNWYGDPIKLLRETQEVKP